MNSTLDREQTDILTETQKRFYEENGYLVLDGLFPPAEVDAIEAYFDEWKDSDEANFECEGEVFAKVKLDGVDRTKQQVRAIHPHRTSRQAFEWMLQPAVMDVLGELLHKPALAVQTMYYYKPPGTRGQGMHQDNFYLLAKPATCIAAWTAIDDADEENGALMVVPGSHRRDIICTGTGGESWTVTGGGVIGSFPEGCRPVTVPVRRGQTMVFGGNLIHGSGPNRSKNRWRRTFIGHYADEATESLARFYHPIHDRYGNVMTKIEEHSGGGPCGDGWQGAVH